MKTIFCTLLAMSSVGAISLPGVRIMNDGPPVEVVGLPSQISPLPFENGGELVSVPEVQREAGRYFPLPDLPPMAIVELYCRANHDNIPCQFFVNVYHCPGCSTEMNGGLPALLPMRGFQVGSCGAKFTDPTTGDFAHPMVAFRVEVEAGAAVPIELPKELRLAAIFGGDHEQCKWAMDDVQCAARPPRSHCGWNRDEKRCESVWCPNHRNHNKGPDAPVCPRHCLGGPKLPMLP